MSKKKIAKKKVKKPDQVQTDVQRYVKLINNRRITLTEVATWLITYHSERYGTSKFDSVRGKVKRRLDKLVANGTLKVVSEPVYDDFGELTERKRSVWHAAEVSPDAGNLITVDVFVEMLSSIKKPETTFERLCHQIMSGFTVGSYRPEGWVIASRGVLKSELFSPETLRHAFPDKEFQMTDEMFDYAEGALDAYLATVHSEINQILLAK